MRKLLKYAEIFGNKRRSFDIKRRQTHECVHLFQLVNHAKYICKIFEYPGPSYNILRKSMSECFHT